MERNLGMNRSKYFLVLALAYLSSICGISYASNCPQDPSPGKPPFDLLREWSISHNSQSPLAQRFVYTFSPEGTYTFQGGNPNISFRLESGYFSADSERITLYRMEGQLIQPGSTKALGCDRRTYQWWIGNDPVMEGTSSDFKALFLKDSKGKIEFYYP